MILYYYTPCACARGKAIGFVCHHKNHAKSIGVIFVSVAENLMSNSGFLL